MLVEKQLNRCLQISDKFDDESSKQTIYHQSNTHAS